MRIHRKSFHESYTLGPKINHGHDGDVFLCHQKKTGAQFACKISSNAGTAAAAAKEEIKVMQHLRLIGGHPNVVSIVDSFDDYVERKTYIVMELLKGADLLDMLNGQERTCSQLEAARLITNVVQALGFLHSAGVIHGDVKLENFVLETGEDLNTLKAVDFGRATFIKSAGEKKARKTVGTACYWAPEILKGLLKDGIGAIDFGPEGDVWSAGVMLYVLLAGTMPFKFTTIDEMLELVDGKEVDLTSEPWPSISRCGKDLLRRMLDRNPSTRITPAEILRHPWIQLCNMYS